MPPPIMVLGLVLLGWPLLQLASVVTLRDPRRQLRRLAASLRADDALAADDRALVDRVVAEAQGSWAFVVAPIALPLAVLAAAIAELFVNERPSRERPIDDVDLRFRQLEVSIGRRSGAEHVDDDKRFQALRNLSFEIACLRWPLTTLLTIFACIPALPLYLIAYGVRETIAVVPRGAALMIQIVTLTESGLHAARQR